MHSFILGMIFGSIVCGVIFGLVLYLFILWHYEELEQVKKEKTNA